jgi:hypothetical protein
MQAMTAGMIGLKQAAESGSFAISRDGAQAYLAAIQRAHDELVTLDFDAYELQQETKLGTSPDAVAMARYNRESATGGAGTIGIVPAIQQLRTALEEARLALEKAVENYGNVDDARAGGMNRY